jgi:hypothetical protein
MPRIGTLCLIALVGLAATTASAAGPGFEGGEWRHQTRLVSAEIPGLSAGLVKLFAGRGARTSCHQPAQLFDHPEALLTADDRASCKLRRLSMSDGRLVFDTFCTNKRFPDGLLVASRGEYTPTTYTITTTSTGTKDGKPVKIVTTGTGKRVAARCAAR